MPQELIPVKNLFSPGYRPFFLAAAIWSAIAVPVWLAAYIHGYAPAAMPAMTWHAHEMIYGYAHAVVAGFVLAAIPNWTGRFPSRGMPLALLVLLWIAARVAILFSAPLGALFDLSFDALLAAAVARELISGRKKTNLPVLAALLLLLAGNTLVHLEALDIADTAALGLRLGIGTLAALIALVALIAWVAYPYSLVTSGLLTLAGFSLAARLARWRTLAIAREPFLLVLHAGYAWLAFGIAFLGLNGFLSWLPASAGVHAITVGAVGTMTLGVMTRTTLRYAGLPLDPDAGTLALYGLVSVAALARFTAALAGAQAALMTSLAGVAWSAAFALFALLYGPLLARPRTR